MTGRRSVILILVVIVVLLVGLTIYLQQRKGEVRTDHYGLVPNQALALLEVDDPTGTLSEVLHNNQLISQLERLAYFEDLFAGLNFLDSLWVREPVEPFLGSSLLMSFHVVGKEEIQWHISVQLNREVRAKDVSGYLERLFPEQVEVRMYDNTGIYEVQSAEGEARVFLTYHQGALVLSGSAILVEQSLRQWEEPGYFATDEGFLRLRSTAGRSSDANLYVRLAGLADLLKPHLSAETYKIFQAPGQFGEWVETDIDISDTRFSFNGFILPEASSYSLALQDQSASAIQIDRVIPANAWFAQVLAFSSAEGLKSTASEKQGEAELRLMSLPGFRASFPALVDGQIALARTNYSNLKPEENCFYIYRMHSRSEAEAFLVNALETYSSTAEVRLEQREYSIDEETVFQVYELPLLVPGTELAGGFLQRSPVRYATFLDNNLILANSMEGLSKYLHNVSLQKTLATDLDYTEFMAHLPSRCNYFTWFSLPKGYAYFRDLVSDDLKELMIEEEDAVKKFQAFGLTLSDRDPMPYASVALLYKPELREEARTAWESMMDTATRFKPYFFTNHYTRNNEIFVQDLRNKVYLINGSGRIMWQLPLGEPILGEVHTIDIYGNGKFQLLFATASKIHLLDRNGNYVERFPVSLRSPATGGVSAFDYEGNQDYRFCIAGSDRKVYLFDKEGNTVKGWGLPLTERPLSYPVQHFRISGKDYLVAADENRLYIWDRRGNIRVKVSGETGKAKGSEIVLNTRTRPYLTYSGPDGTVRTVYFDGSLENTTLREAGADHFFTESDLDGDGKPERILVDDDRLYVYRHTDRLFTYKFENKIQLPPQVYTFSGNDRKIGIVDQIDGHIYLIDNSGKTVRGFPQPGTGMFSIGKLSRRSEAYNLLVPGRGNFLYNYVVY